MIVFGMLSLLPTVRTLGFSWGSVGRKSSCLFCPYQGSNPDLRPPVAAGARRKLGQKLSRVLSSSISLSLEGPLCVFDYPRARAELWISCIKTCAHLFLAESELRRRDFSVCVHVSVRVRVSKL